MLRAHKDPVACLEGGEQPAGPANEGWDAARGCAFLVPGYKLIAEYPLGVIKVPDEVQ